MAGQHSGAAPAVSFSPRSESVRWAASITGALVLHVGVVAAIMAEFSSNNSEHVAQPLAAMTVELAPLPSAPDTPPSEKPPGVQQVEQKVQPQPQPKPEPRKFDPPPEVKGDPPPDALASKQDKDRPQTEQKVAADRTSAPPSTPSQNTDALKAPVQSTPSDAASNARQTWQSRLLAHLERLKRYPGEAQVRRQEDVVFVRFTMDRSGKVLAWRISKSKGYALLDAEVNALIQRASPLPPPPDEVAGNTVELLVGVDFFLPRGSGRGGRP